MAQWVSYLKRWEGSNADTDYRRRGEDGLLSLQGTNGGKLHRRYGQQWARWIVRSPARGLRRCRPGRDASSIGRLRSIAALERKEIDAGAAFDRAGHRRGQGKGT